MNVWEVPDFGTVKLSKAAEKMSKRQRLWSHQISEAVMQGTVEVETDKIVKRVHKGVGLVMLKPIPEHPAYLITRVFRRKEDQLLRHA